MLIPSKRHTAADLSLWRDLEAADRVHGATLAGKAAKAIDEIRRFAAAGPCYVATSWGKDSVVATHLVSLSGVVLPVVNLVQLGLQRDMGVPKVRDAFLSRFAIDYHEIEVATDAEQAETKHAPALDMAIALARRKFGTSRWVGGLRADESAARKLQARIRTTKEVVASCWPIGWWSDADVFGWLAYHDLPTHSAYGMLGGGRYDRGRIRVSIIGGQKGRNFGRAEWEREYYGDVLNRIAAKQR